MRRSIIAAPVLAFAVTACGLIPPGAGGSPPSAAGTRPPAADAATQARPPASRTAQPSTEAPPETSATLPEGGGSGGPEREAIAGRTVRVKSAEVRVEITGLRREGRLVTLNWSVNTVNDGTWYIYKYMSADGESRDVSGVSLVDPVNAKRYRVARSGGRDGPCVCSQTEDLYSVGPGESAALSATFPAPPPQISKINVELPLLGTFTDVPLA